MATSTLKDIYYKPESPASFSGVQSLLKQANKLQLEFGRKPINRKTVVHFLRDQDNYSLFKLPRKVFLRNPYIIKEVLNQVQIDLVDYQDLAEFNKNFKYVLFALDLRSRYVWIRFLKTKTSEEVTKKFVEILKEMGKNPTIVQSDRGKEFGKVFQNMLKEKKIKYFQQVSGEYKTPHLDRAIRTIQSKLSKAQEYKNTKDYLELLPKLVKSYNNTMNRALENKTPKYVLEKRLGSPVQKPILTKPEKVKFKVGDYVRISGIKKAFVHAYRGEQSYEKFIVDRIKVKEGYRPVYYLKDLSGEDVTGQFYADEMTLVSKPREGAISTVEKILKTKRVKGKKMVLVKWKEFPKKMASWIEASKVE